LESVSSFDFAFDSSQVDSDCFVNGHKFLARISFGEFLQNEESLSNAAHVNQPDGKIASGFVFVITCRWPA
jgi:hypothetical protein